MTHIYRFERPADGKGPFSDWDWRAEVSDYMPHFNTLPTPHEESQLTFLWHPGRDYIGTLTPQCLLTWFPKPVVKALSHHNYVLAVYDAPDDAVLRGHYQVAFDKSRATLLQQLPPMELLTLIETSTKES